MLLLILAVQTERPEDQAEERLYCEKANQRRGGVGKETQIISAEVYERVGESKFIPIFCELFEDGSPCLPTYLKSRFATELHLIVDRVGSTSKAAVRPRCFHAIFHARIPRSSWSQGPRFITQCRSSYQIGRSSS